ncbi:membrane protein [Actinorhabdospora filicis]|uniref:Membrane protein n=1 Tax=Actinorhabdospora filicis TaxID=1785913 RepID=A0A9W6WC92_9ACTN|nr:DoxX family protein [Actinorhabdospora filicis]GLZ80843.1 membrane protein [Actinorhabdospora filicis]
MELAYKIVTVVAALWVAFSAYSLWTKKAYTADPLRAYGVDEKFWGVLGALKLAGAVGLVVGFWIPFLGVAAGIGLILYFLGALVFIVRAKWFGHIAAPMMYLLPVGASLILMSLI